MKTKSITITIKIPILYGINRLINKVISDFKTKVHNFKIKRIRKHQVQSLGYGVAR
ncbi:MAG: hypothetical protein KAJ49_09585 [Arcobacteraceae bacterium]|nr:hypothetical protein [Arcobacteraceae bacterium]